ncbi:MAG TPA: S8 family serine peptidase [Steroidobacteraceae bacterium]|nr:S8 family serine peptidase [Steroidobacteraceae bacterium]
MPGPACSAGLACSVGPARAPSRRRALRRLAWLGVALLAAAWPALSPAADSVLFRHRSIDPRASDQIIVKWRSSGVAALQIPTIAGRAQHMRAVEGVQVRPVRTLFGETDVMSLGYVPSLRDMQDILARLNADPAVQYAEPNGYRYLADFPTDPPNDPFFVAGSDNNGSWEGQWYLLPSSATTPSALGVTTAWQTTLGSQSVVVAVLDTGIIEGQPDFTYPPGASSTPKLECGTDNSGQSYCGYDFVSCDQGNTATDSEPDSSADCSATGSAATYYFANDGHDWAEDAADPGDWIDSTDTAMTLFQDAACTTTAPSSWHGTKVAGVIGAVTNNGIGVAGIAPLTTLLPVRVIGKCAARVSDIAAGILWAAGVGVSLDAGTIAASPAANIINLSLAANTPCSQTEQDAINQAIDAGVLVVAAAGNEGGPLDAPANCSGVVSVVGLRAAGTKVPYSNLSSSAAPATIAAPGGNCVNNSTTAGITVSCDYAIMTTSDAGTTTPSPTPGFYTYELLNPSFVDSGANTDNAAVAGTSFAAPMVAGTAALMLAAEPTLTPAQLIARLKSSALPFPKSSSTTSTECQLASASTDTNGNFTDVSQQAECVCTPQTCGAGMLDAAAAVNAASGLFVQITTSHSSGAPGQRIQLNGTGSTPDAGATITRWRWSTSPSTSDQIANPDQPVATLVMPGLRSIDVVLTITDSSGHTASASARIESAFAAASGSGSLDPLTLALLAAAAAWRVAHRTRRPRRDPAQSRRLTWLTRLTRLN